MRKLVTFRLWEAVRFPIIFLPTVCYPAGWMSEANVDFARDIERSEGEKKEGGFLF